MVAAIIPFLLVALLSLSQFFSDKINIEKSKHRNELISFASAIAVTYLLFNLLPEVYRNSEGPILFIPLIFGFSMIHLVEKFYYETFKERFYLDKVKTYHDELHATVLFIYHFALGAVLIGALKSNFISGLFLVPPLLMFTTIGNWSVHHTYIQRRNVIRLLLASSTLVGAIFISFMEKINYDTMFIQQVIFNFAVGILLFLVIREALPTKKEGSPLLYVAGITLYGMILLFLSGRY